MCCTRQRETRSDKLFDSSNAGPLSTFSCGRAASLRFLEPWAWPRQLDRTRQETRQLLDRLLDRIARQTSTDLDSYLTEPP
jgi:hypothetical protein